MGFESLDSILRAIRSRYPGLSKRIHEAEALARWEKAVGSIIARHARAIRVQEAVLWVEVDHPIWKSELHHRKRQILDAMNALGQKPEGSVGPIQDILFLDPRKGGS